MPGEQEPSSGLQIEHLQSKQGLLSEHKPESPTAKLPFLSKISQTKGQSQIVLQRINLLLTAFGQKSTETGQGKVGDIQPFLNELAKDETKSPEEYLQLSQQALGSSDRLIGQIDAERKALESTITQKDRRWQIEQKLEDLEKVKGLRRIPAALERRRLVGQMVGIEREIDSINSLIQVKKDQLDQLREQEKPVRVKQEQLLLAEIVQAVGSIRSGYEQVFKDIIEDGTITGELQDAYIKSVIIPRAEKTMKNGKMPRKKMKEIYLAIKDGIRHRSGTVEEREEFRDKLRRLLGQGYGQIDDFYATLTTGRDEQVVQLLVVTMAAEDISQIRVAALPHYSHYHYMDGDREFRFSQSIKEAIEPGYDGMWRNNESFGSRILSKLDESDKRGRPNMDLWQAVKDSPAANQAFGEMIKRLDQEYYQTALDKSLSDTNGEHINLLSYYPTPEAIRNVVLIAAADAQNYRTVHANWVLRTLAERSDWENILDEAEKVYPSLKGAREVLRTWKFDAYQNNPAVQEAAKDFALDIFESKPSDGRLLTLATESLPNSSLLAVLAKREVITEKQATILGNADVFLKKLANEIVQMNLNKDYSRPFISEYAFTNGLRTNLLGLMSEQPNETREQQIAIINRFEFLAEVILENKTNYPVLNYFTADSAVKRIKDPYFQTNTLPVFLKAYEACPALITNKNLLGEFCRQFEGESTVIFFRDMNSAYQNQEDQLVAITALVGDGLLSKERALELPSKAQSVFSSTEFKVAKEFPQLFLETDDGLAFLNQVTQVGIFSLDKGLEVRIGEKIQNLMKAGKLDFTQLLRCLASSEIEQTDQMLSQLISIEANQQNWPRLLVTFIGSQVALGSLPNLSPASQDKINTLFKDSKVKDLCLNGLRDNWLNYLKSGKLQEVPFFLRFISEFINYCGGAGALSQIESLNMLISAIGWSFSRETTVERTKSEIAQVLVKMEERFDRERWSNEDRTDFYNISRDILIAAPSLFSDYLGLFERLNPSQLKTFSKEIYPLFRTKLVLLEKKDKNDHRTFDKEQLLNFRKDIRNFAAVFNSGESVFKNMKQKLFEEIRGLFGARFGITKIPQEFSGEHMRSFTNISTYLANLHDRTVDKETILGFYLSLMMNDKWDAFRNGEKIDPSGYLTSEKSALISRLLKERQRLNPLTAEQLGISEEDMPVFFKLLQQETQNVVVGNIETIDIKLTNIILNLRGLEDLDLYPDLIDKQRMQLLLDFGNKKMGSVVAKMYQSLVTSGRDIQFSEEETKIRQQIVNAMGQLGLSLTPQTLKEHFQDGIKPLATVVNILNFIEDTRAESEIDSLRDLLKPSEDIVKVFRRLGEDFKPASGALALSQDLSYLDNLIVKREDEITPEEKIMLMQYTTSIRDQVVKLEGIYGQIKNKFASFKQSNVGQRNTLLQDKLNQIDRIVNVQITSQAITSTVTNNLNIIIENMRECLSCTREGCNNDTDLTFGDTNKFYLYSQSETQEKGSISDQIAFLEPITRTDGSMGMAFVLDHIYGTCTPDILENQTEAVLKKCRSIKQRFPDIRLYVLVSNVALSTGGASIEMIEEKFRKKNVLAERELVEVNLAESAMGDHYIEFGGDSRSAGKRSVNGLMLSI